MVRIAYHDAPSFSEWVEMMSAISLDPAYRPGFCFLVDRGAARECSPSFARRVADYLARHADEFGVHIASATVVSEEALEATQAMISLCKDSSQMHVFTALREAEEWLAQTTYLQLGNEEANKQTTLLQ